MAAASFRPSEEEVIERKFGLVDARVQLNPPKDLLVKSTPPSEYWPKSQLPVPAASFDPLLEDETVDHPRPYWIVLEPSK